MLRQKTFEYDTYDFYVEKKGLFKKESTKYDYHMKFEFSEENYSLIIDRSCDQTVYRKNTLVRSHAEIYLREMPKLVLEPLILQQMSGHALHLRCNSVAYAEYVLDTGAEVCNQTNGYRTIYFCVPREIFDDFIKFLGQKVPLS